jgi:hypothetical protein
VDANVFGDQTFDFGKNRALRVRLIQDLVPLGSSQNESHFRQVFQFPLKSTMASTNGPDKLPYIE